MSSVVETTLKALKDFESQLESAMLDASDARRKLIKDASDLAETAKASAMSGAQAIAADTIAKARAEAEKEAEGIKKKGADDLAKFESSISRRKGKATEWVVEQLMGGSQ